MVAVFQSPVTAEDIKAKAKALGADIVGIADGAVMNENPPDPKDPRRPGDITDHDADRVWNAMVVVAEQPHYDDWTLRNNYVMADDVERRLKLSVTRLVGDGL